MELPLHYVWKNKLFAPTGLVTDDGRTVEVIDVGLHNHNAGPDFFNAKIKLDGMLWVGNVEIHEQSSDWYRHGHDGDEAYQNVVLHVVERLEGDVLTKRGERVPQLQLSVPDNVRQNYQELMAEEKYPPCYRIIPHLPLLKTHAWLSALCVERLEQKTLRIANYLERSKGDLEHAFFVALARAFGFGVNSDAFEQWALSVPLMAVGKHRDNLVQVEAFFMGQAGLLSDERVESARRDEYFLQLQREYQFLSHKFSLRPVPYSQWRMLRMRPQNFPQIRLSQLSRLYHEQRINLSRLIETSSIEGLRELLMTATTDYWRTHYVFGKPTVEAPKRINQRTADLLIINAVAPMLFIYGRRVGKDGLCERAYSLLEQIKAETDHITRSWQQAGLCVSSAADSQALLQLRLNYCDRKDCMRCRFGTEYMKQKR